MFSVFAKYTFSIMKGEWLECSRKTKINNYFTTNTTQ